MKLKWPLLLKPLGTIIQENYQSFYPSEPFQNEIPCILLKKQVSKGITIKIFNSKKEISFEDVPFTELSFEEINFEKKPLTIKDDLMKTLQLLSLYDLDGWSVGQASIV